MLFNRIKPEALPVKYEIYVREEEEKEIKLERYKCPSCNFLIRKEDYYKSVCPTCGKKIRW